MIWMDLGALGYNFNYCEETEDYSAIAWPVGRFKSHDRKLGCYMIDLGAQGMQE